MEYSSVWRVGSMEGQAGVLGQYMNQLVQNRANQILKLVFIIIEVTLFCLVGRIRAI